MADHWCDDVDIFFCVVLWNGLVSPILWTYVDGLQVCSAWDDDPIDASSSTSRFCFKGRVVIAVFKIRYDEGVCGCLFSLLLV